MTNVTVENFLLFDALGSVDRILGQSQSVTDRYLYEAFGKEVFRVPHHDRRFFAGKV